MSDTKLSETDKAYFAGLVDVSGSVKIRRRYRDGEIVSREIVLSIEGLSGSQVGWVKARFKRAQLARVGNTPATGVYFITRWAATALSEILDYIVSRQHEARLVFKFASAIAKSGKRLTETQDAIREEVDRELTALKRGA